MGTDLATEHHELAWDAASLEQRQDWTHTLTAAETDELLEAASRVADVPLPDIRPADFPLPLLQSRLRQCAETLDRGPGVYLFHGVPVQKLDDAGDAIARRLILGAVSHLGRIAEQGGGQGVVVDVTDQGYGLERPTLMVRGFQTRTELDFHVDGHEIAALLCLRPSVVGGGESRMVSAVWIYDEVRRRRPDLFPLLFEEWYFDRRNYHKPGQTPYYHRPLCTLYGGRLTFKIVPKFIHSAQRHADVPRLSDERLELLELLRMLAEEPGAANEFRLARGDIQIVNNCSVWHARRQYDDAEDHKRHLLRVWADLHEGRPTD